MKNLLIVFVLVTAIFLISVIGVINEPVSTDNQWVVCDALNPCETGDCYKFSDLASPVCYEGNPCERCASKVCNIAESYPMQVFCQ